MFKELLLLAALTSPSYGHSNNPYTRELVANARLEVENLLAENFQGDIILNQEGFDLKTEISMCMTGEEYTIIEPSNYNSRIAVKVSCNEPNWSYYIPFRAQVMQQVLVASTPLSSKTIISATNSKLVKRNILSLNQGYITDPNSVIGMQTTSPLRAGSIIRKQQLVEKIAVHKGDLITIRSSNNGVQVSTQGIAEHQAAVGDRLKVKNASSKKIVEGIVVASNVVEVSR